ncbi:MAG: universal stress protein [Rhodobacteraceae bacterium]|nr:universal stress protein [Paracoccaceae bacterium]
MFKNIVVAVDGSDPSNRAISVACDLAKNYHSDIHLVHTPELDTAVGALGISSISFEPSDDQVAKAGKTVMDQALAQADAAGCPVKSTTIGNGAPYQEVLSATMAQGADLIVTGRRGLGNLAGLVLGSTSQKIAHDAPCAVLTVK